jgi:hypothetical protein
MRPKEEMVSYAYLISPANPDTAKVLSITDLASKIQERWPTAKVEQPSDTNEMYSLRWRLSSQPFALLGWLQKNLKVISLEGGDIADVAQFAIWYRRTLISYEQATLFYISSLDQEVLLLTPETDEKTIVNLFG